MANASNESSENPLAPAEVYVAPQRKHGSRIPTLVWLLLLVAALAGGFYVGHYVVVEPDDGVSFGALANKTSITEAELDSAVATYVIDGEVFEVTAREALAQQSSLDAARNADGGYIMPSAESVISAVRTALLMRDAEAKGITVTDEEVVAYAQETFGTDDLASLAAAYTMDQETLTNRLRESATMAKLRVAVVGEAPEAPQAPAAPEEGKEAEPTADYAAYIIGLAGDEWDAEHGIWSEEGGDYATALKDYDVRADAATYDAAQTAYNVAYQLHSVAVTSASTQWTEYVNTQLSTASVALSSVVS